MTVEFKDGDFVKVECCGREGILIYKKGIYDDFCGCYGKISSERREIGLNGQLELWEDNCCESKFYCRLATKEEKQLFINRMRNEAHCEWNPTTHTFDPIHYHKENIKKEIINTILTIYSMDKIEEFKKKLFHKTTDMLPELLDKYKDDIYPEIPCLVRGNLSTGYGIGVRYWNVTSQCWDDEECDDKECEVYDVDEWAYLDDIVPDLH